MRRVTVKRVLLGPAWSFAEIALIGLLVWSLPWWGGPAVVALILLLFFEGQRAGQELALRRAKRYLAKHPRPAPATVYHWPPDGGFVKVECASREEADRLVERLAPTRLADVDAGRSDG